MHIFHLTIFTFIYTTVTIPRGNITILCWHHWSHLGTLIFKCDLHNLIAERCFYYDVTNSSASTKAERTFNFYDDLNLLGL